MNGKSSLEQARQALTARLRLLSARQPKATLADLERPEPFSLIVLATRHGAALCQLPGTDRVLTFRGSVRLDAVPGRLVKVRPGKFWICSGHPYLAGTMVETRFEPEALGLTPLNLKQWGEWDPGDEDCYNEVDGNDVPWLKPILDAGARPDFEFEECLPGLDPGDPDVDPIHFSVELRRAGDPVGAWRLLMDLCQADLRCLDAHAHLGAFHFDSSPDWAIRHYEVGVGIGRLSMGSGFQGLLRWPYLENRPFLRCLHGFGLCLWRLGRFGEAGQVFEELLWLNPLDHLGARFSLESVRVGDPWAEIQDEE